jgi:hypothetical protein
VQQVGSFDVTALLLAEVQSLISPRNYDRGYLGVAVCLNGVWESTAGELKDLVRKYCGTAVVQHASLLCMQATAGQFPPHVDSDFGTEDGETIRLHFPLVTHEDATISCVAAGGGWEKSHMNVGRIYYFDPRSLHFITNNSDTDRIHLVVDVVASDTTRSLIGG